MPIEKEGRAVKMADETVSTSSSEGSMPLASQGQQERGRRSPRLSALLQAGAPASAFGAPRLVVPRVSLDRPKPMLLDVDHGRRIWEQDAAVAMSPLVEAADRTALQMGRQLQQQLGESFIRGLWLSPQLTGFARLGEQMCQQLVQASGFAEQLRRLVDQAAFPVARQFQQLAQSTAIGQQWRLVPPSRSTRVRSIELALAPTMRRIRELLLGLVRVGAGLAQDFALRALMKASEVREAVLCGDRLAVVRFIADWLGWSPTEARVEAVSMVLLESGWDEVVATPARPCGPGGSSAHERPSSTAYNGPCGRPR
jgi:hypothetical protein